MQIILFRVTKLEAGTGVGLMKDDKAQVRAINKMRGELGPTVDICELSLLGGSDFCQLSLVPVGLDGRMILRGIGSSERKRLPERTAHFVRKFSPQLVPIGRR
jgi:hypothetical protein